MIYLRSEPDIKFNEELNNLESPYSNSSSDSYYLGNRIGMTYCSRMFSDCDDKDCRLQSPNFPGVYPRNMTCYYAVRQQTVPPGKHAIISVYQDEGQMVNIRSQSALYARPTQATNPQLSTLKVNLLSYQLVLYFRYDGLAFSIRYAILASTTYSRKYDGECLGCISMPGKLTRIAGKATSILAESHPCIRTTRTVAIGTIYI